MVVNLFLFYLFQYFIYKNEMMRNSIEKTK